MKEFALTSDLTVDGEGRRILVRGSPLHAVTIEDTLGAIGRTIERDDRAYICASNVHVMMEARHDSRLREALRGASLVVPDGMPLVWALRLAGFPLLDRVYGPTLFETALARSAERGWRHFFFGGLNGTARDLARTIESRWPAARIAGHVEPPMQPCGHREPADVIERVNGSEADIVWVGLGAPKQEIWMANHRGLLRAPVLVGVGQAFDVVSGHARMAPAWMQDRGLEWLFRLGREPRRLWRRYLLYNPIFLVILLRAYGASRLGGARYRGMLGCDPR